MPIFTIGRKAKDRRDLEAAQKTGGSVVIRSKNKITNPSNPSQTLGRGSTVTVTHRPVVTQDKPMVTPGKRTTTVKKETSFVPGDYQNRVHDRPTTEALGKSLGESPKKVKLRMDAQSKGETTYTAPSGNKEYSGRMRTSYTPSTSKEPDKVTPGKIHMAMVNKTSVVPQAPQNKSQSIKRSGDGLGLRVHRSAGTNSKGRPQNYLNLQMGGKNVIKVKTLTRGTKRK